MRMFQVVSKSYLLVVVIGVVIYYSYSPPPQKPVLLDILWKSDDTPEDVKILPFTIDVPTHVIKNLKDRLQNSTLVPPLRGVNFEYGFNSNHLKKVIDYWLNDYKWPERQKLLNAVPQFRTKISGLYVHFIHVKPDAKLTKGKKILPLLMLHGWPGSVKEFYGIFARLTQSRPEYDFVFEVIAPSLPGYGFSEAATIPGMNPPHMGLIMKKLMNRLGFDRFYIQGGDWGSIIGSSMTTLFPESIIGFHSNMCSAPLSIWSTILLVLGSIYPRWIVDNDVFKNRLYPLSNFYSHILEESGYLHLQATKPDTIGVALTDSPAGLAAYILEKFSTWENFNFRNLPDGGLSMKKNYCMDDLLDNVMIYWITNSIVSSMRLYSEAFSGKTRDLQLDSIPTDVPTACANYPYDITYSPEITVKNKFRNLIHFEHMSKGGHFAAFEQPEIFSQDFWNAIFKIEKTINPNL